MVRCNVKGCHRRPDKDKEHSFFLWPKKQLIRQQWANFAQFEGCTKNLRICSDHFDKHDIKKNTPPKRLLVPNAVPTLLSPKEILKRTEDLCVEHGIFQTAETPTARRINSSVTTNAEVTLKDHTSEAIILQRPAVKDGCLHNDNGIDFEVLKAKDNEPAQINIKTNSFVKISLRDEREDEISPDAHNLGAETSYSTPKKNNMLSRKLDLSSSDTPNRPITSPTNTACAKRKSIQLTPKSLKLYNKSRTIARLRSQINRYRREKKFAVRMKMKQDVETIINASAKFLEKEALILFASQLRLSVKNKYAKRYSDEVKDIALSIKYHSPKTYKLLENFLHIPTIRTLNEYQKKFLISPGLNCTVLNQLRNNFLNCTSHDRLVSVLFDEISLATEVHYDAANDFFHGYADDGTGRTKEVAHCALVAMITWINKPIKQTVGYWLLGRSGNSAKTHDIMVNTIHKLFEVGLIVTCLICDQGTRNIGLMKKYKITRKNPFLEFNISDNIHKVYLIFDPPHLIKSFRNNLFKKRLKYRGGYVDWNLIYKVYLLSIQMKINFIPKINDRHFSLQQNSAKMTVSLATQIFSNSMYLAYRAYSLIKPEEFITVEKDTTADFLLDMDKLFDSLNSHLLQPTIESKLYYALSETSGHIEFLNEMLVHLGDSEFERKGDKQKAVPPCITGMILTINSVLKLSEELRETYNLPTLRTGRLNQDPLENLFAVIRQQNGCSVNPSTRSFETALKQNFITQLTKVSNSANCQDDKNVIFAKLSMLNHAMTKSQTKEKNLSILENVTNNNLEVMDCSHPPVGKENEYNSNPENQHLHKKIQTDYVEYVTEIESDMALTETALFTKENAIYYICGYLARKFLKIHKNCDECINLLILPKSDSNYQEYKLFTVMKNYADKNGLQYSTDLLFSTVQKWNSKFEIIIGDHIHQENISVYLHSELRYECPSFQLCCLEATTLFLNVFIKVRCFWEARFIRRELKKCDTATVDKKCKRKLSKFCRSTTGASQQHKNHQSENQKLCSEQNK